MLKAMLKHNQTNYRYLFRAILRRDKGWFTHCSNLTLIHSVGFTSKRNQPKTVILFSGFKADDLQSDRALPRPITSFALPRDFQPLKQVSFSVSIVIWCNILWKDSTAEHQNVMALTSSLTIIRSVSYTQKRKRREPGRAREVFYRYSRQCSSTMFLVFTVCWLSFQPHANTHV